jgi:hypothetical protein
MDAEARYEDGYKSGYGIGYGDALYDIEQAAYACRESRGHLAPDIERDIPTLDDPLPFTDDELTCGCKCDCPS